MRNQFPARIFARPEKIWSTEVSHLHALNAREEYIRADLVSKELNRLREAFKHLMDFAPETYSETYFIEDSSVLCCVYCGQPSYKKHSESCEWLKAKKVFDAPSLLNNGEMTNE